MYSVFSLVAGYSEACSEPSQTSKFLFNDYEISYEELLLKSDRATMNVNRLRILCTEIYEFMRDLFSLRENNRLVREKYIC